MKQKCVWCGKVTEKEPLGNDWVADGICENCLHKEMKAYTTLANIKPQEMR